MWTIQGLGGKKFGCFAKTRHAAKQRAQATRSAVKVTYHGPRPKSNNRRVQESNFLMHPNGTIDPKIDPTWYTNQAKK